MINLEGLQAHAMAQADATVVEAMTAAAKSARNMILGAAIATVFTLGAAPAEAGLIAGQEQDYQTQEGSGFSNVLIKGAGAAVGAGLGSLIGHGGGRTAAMVVGGILGSEVADHTFGHKAGTANPNGQAPSAPGSFGGFRGTPAGFHNGTQPLAPNERSAMDRAEQETLHTLQGFREARASVNNIQYQYDFATGNEKRDIARSLYQAQSEADYARRGFESARLQYSTLVNDAAAKYNRDVNDYADTAFRLAAIPTAGAVSPDDLDRAINSIPSADRRASVSMNR